MRWMWNDQTGGTNRFLMRRADWSSMSPACCQTEAPRRVIRVRGRHRGPIRALSGTHTPGGCVRWMWNDQTGGTNRFLMRRADWSSMSPACCQTEAPRRVIRVRGRHRGPIRALSGTHTPGGCVRWMWNDQTGGTNRFLMRRADWSSMSPACCQTEAPRRVIRVRGRHRGPIRALSGTHTPGGCVRWMWNDQTGGTNRFLMRRADWSSMSPACCCQTEAPRRVIRVRGRHRGPIRALSGTHTPGGCVRWMWNDQTGGTNRFLMRRADWSSMSPACCSARQRLQDVLFEYGAATEVPSVH